VQTVEPTRARVLDWHALLVGSALVDLVVTLVVGLALRDREALAFAAVLAAGLALLRLRRGLVGRVVLFLVFLDVEFWMATAAFSNVSHRGTLRYVVVPMALAVASLAGLMAAVGAQRGAGGGVARTVAVAAVAVFVVAVGVSRLPGVGRSDKAQAGDLTISAKDVKFSTKSLSSRAGTVAVRMTNHDLFWHTFTVDKLGVDLRVPVGAARRVTFTALPGTYEFHCAIPGHKSSMHGTLTIS
jgi:plastocyanin